MAFREWGSLWKALAEASVDGIIADFDDLGDGEVVVNLTPKNRQARMRFIEHLSHHLKRRVWENDPNTLRSKQVPLTKEHLADGKRPYIEATRLLSHRWNGKDDSPIQIFDRKIDHNKVFHLELYLAFHDGAFSFKEAKEIFTRTREELGWSYEPRDSTIVKRLKECADRTGKRGSGCWQLRHHVTKAGIDWRPGQTIPEDYYAL